MDTFNNVNTFNTTIAFDESRTFGQIFTVTCVLLMVAILGLVGNSVVVFLILKSQHLQDKLSNLFLLNLAVSDLLTTVVVTTTSIHGKKISLFSFLN